LRDDLESAGDIADKRCGCVRPGLGVRFSVRIRDDSRFWRRNTERLRKKCIDLRMTNRANDARVIFEAGARERHNRMSLRRRRSSATRRNPSISGSRISTSATGTAWRVGSRRERPAPAERRHPWGREPFVTSAPTSRYRRRSMRQDVRHWAYVAHRRASRASSSRADRESVRSSHARTRSMRPHE
jgi:hypothetical protein